MSHTLSEEQKAKGEQLGLGHLELLDDCKEAAIRAGRYMLDSRGSIEVDHKGIVDLVTNVDRKCEGIVFDYLKGKYAPLGHKFIGEEGEMVSELTDEFTWICDPIDGTTNFVHNFPMYCVSVACVKNKFPCVAAIYDPVRDDMYTAIVGHGAFLNGKKIHVDSSQTLQEALVCTNFGHSREKEILDFSHNAVKKLLSNKLRGIRMTGSCCMAMCHVARGIASAYFECDIGGIWDVAAALLICSEAGGLVCDMSGAEITELKCGKQQIICGNKDILAAIHNVISADSARKRLRDQ